MLFIEILVLSEGQAGETLNLQREQCTSGHRGNFGWKTAFTLLCLFSISSQRNPVS